MWDQPQRGLGSDGIIKKSCQRKAERGKDSMQKDFHDHLLSKGHNGLINDVETVFTDRTDPSQPTRREEFWRNKLKTLAPYGLNVEAVLAGVYCFW